MLAAVVYIRTYRHVSCSDVHTDMLAAVMYIQYIQTDMIAAVMYTQTCYLQ